MKLIPNGVKTNHCIQTPEEVCKLIVNHFKPHGSVLEPCKGDGNFLKYLYDADWCEIKEGRDFFKYDKKVDWIITNPPFDLMRKFIIKSMQIADNIVFLTTINHLWLKARLRDIKENEFGIKEILLLDTPKTFPSSGFQVGCFYLKRNWKGDIRFSDYRNICL
jgi:hypothetical protein